MAAGGSPASVASTGEGRVKRSAEERAPDTTSSSKPPARRTSKPSARLIKAGVALYAPRRAQ
jgi:hypothetical protein